MTTPRVSIRRAVTWVAAIGAALTLAGCDWLGEQQTGSESTAEERATEADGDAEADVESSLERHEEPERERDEEASAKFADRSLDIDDLHPTGVLFQLRELRFEGNAIVLDVHVNNGHSNTVNFPVGGHMGDRLRLVDDLGNVYNFQAPEEEGNTIELSPGEVLEGSMAFLGPPRQGASELHVVVNRHDDPLEGFDPAERSDYTIFPDIVVGPIPLEEK